eukprot:TRINITY_DN5953_c0_g1_i1.p1 TRINITY_DN5953_c0_g1~~TRINITY_DN5953_c0_g1_i1.p1  ORF type:complete len:943 (-),score=265.24 TRINITY_DN5953_c0_g1_i1:43-2871(-)
MSEPPSKKAKIEVENEKNAPADKGAKISEAPVFHVEDTTMNVIPSTTGNMLSPLTDGGLQYLMAGARSSVGLKSGRYMFEVKMLQFMDLTEDSNAKARMLYPRSQLRIGFATDGSSLFLGETDQSVCFDSAGTWFRDNKKTLNVAQKFTTGDVVSAVLNLESSGKNAFTLSLFKNGERACPPQAIPECLRGKTLFPAVSFRNVTFHYNFGPTPLAPLPFTCRMVKDASVKDCTVKASAAPKDGKFEALFPVCVPDEGGFDWLDIFLASHPHTEISDRAILNWCEKSGINRPKGYSAAARTSNDKPEIGIGITALDDLSVQRTLQTIAPLQKRHYVVMEVRGNLLQEDRRRMAERWAGFKRIAMVVVGNPPSSFKQSSQELMLKMKQESSDATFRTQMLQQKQKREIERRQKKLEFEKKLELKKQIKKAEAAKRMKEAEMKGEKYEEEKADEEDEEFKDDTPEPPETQPPKVQLTEEEKNLTFRKVPAPDLTPFNLNTALTKFTLPDKDEDFFDEVKYAWQPEGKAKQYLKEWIQSKRMTARVEDLKPGDWFNEKKKEWDKVLQAYHAKQNAFKAAEATKETKRKLREAAREQAEREGKPPPEEGGEDIEPKADLEELDVFGIEDVSDIGNGDPLYAFFGFEDWTLLSLRYELHLLAHAFRRDADASGSAAVPVDNMSFYYQTYFKKALTLKFYSVESAEELLDLVNDTMLLTGKSRVLEPQLPDDLSSTDIFVMLTEESRRDRIRRIDLGEESVRLNIVPPQQAAMNAASAKTGVTGVPPPPPMSVAGMPAPRVAFPKLQSAPMMPQQPPPPRPATGPTVVAPRAQGAWNKGGVSGLPGGPMGPIGGPMSGPLGMAGPMGGNWGKGPGMDGGMQKGFGDKGFGDKGFGDKGFGKGFGDKGFDMQKGFDKGKGFGDKGFDGFGDKGFDKGFGGKDWQKGWNNW